MYFDYYLFSVPTVTNSVLATMVIWLDSYNSPESTYIFYSPKSILLWKAIKILSHITHTPYYKLFPLYLGKQLSLPRILFPTLSWVSSFLPLCISSILPGKRLHFNHPLILLLSPSSHHSIYCKLKKICYFLLFSELPLHWCELCESIGLFFLFALLSACCLVKVEFNAYMVSIWKSKLHMLVYS
jgi:hypothetical protein